MKNKKNLTCLSAMLVSCFFIALPLKAQVMIGDNKTPETFSLLELFSNSKGLRMPQLSTSERDALGFKAKFISPAPGSEEEKLAPLAKGLLIYNTTIKCLELWNGIDWISLCSDTSSEPIDVCVPPVLTGVILGATSVFAGETDLYYSVIKLPDFSYLWTIPSGWSQTGALNMIKTTAGAANGKIAVVPSITCEGKELNGAVVDLDVSIYTLGCCKNPPKITITGGAKGV